MSDSSGETSPTGERHPGDVRFVDHIAGREWTENARDVLRGIAWYQGVSTWEPVVRVEMSGSGDQREISRFGVDGKFFDVTLQMRSVSEPRPEPRPMPDDE
jgi:hypothetical protein